MAAGQTAPVNFKVSKNKPETYTVHVGSTPAGSLTVDAFANNDSLGNSIIGLFVMGIAGIIYLC